MPRQRLQQNRVKGPFAISDGRYRVVARGPSVQEATGRWEKTFHAATKAKADVLAEQLRATFRDLTSAPIAEALDEYATHLEKALDYKARSIRDVRTRLRLLLDGSGAITMNDITVDHVREWLSGGYGDGELLARETQKGHRNCARRWFLWGLQAGYCGTDPTARVALTGKRHRGKPHLRRQEIARLLAACEADSSEGSLVVHLMLVAAARPTEVLSMRVRDLDLGPAKPPEGAPPHTPTWTIPFERSEAGGTKTEAGEGDVELPEIIATRLRLRIEGKPLGAWVFPAGRSAKGHRGLSYMGDHFRRLCGQAKLGRTVPPYSVRGSMLAAGRRRGMPMWFLAELAGHGDQGVTRDNYVSGEVDNVVRMKEARESLDRVSRYKPGTDGGA